MGSDDLFKKRREARKKRNREFRNTNTDSYLIITEGTKTEPFYLNGLKRQILQKVGGAISVVNPTIEIMGEGTCTERLIAIADEYVSNAKILYKNIWIVFDKDDFDDFDEAIEMGLARGYSIAWSNQSFEYWIYLHFHYSDVNLNRHQWNDKLNVLFREYGLSEDGYEKNYENLYELLDSIGGVETAIKNAKRRMAEYDAKNCKPSLYAPGTTVHVLVEELKEYLK